MEVLFGNVLVSVEEVGGGSDGKSLGAGGGHGGGEGGESAGP